MILSEAFTDEPQRMGPGPITALTRWIRSSGWRLVGYDSAGDNAQVAIGPGWRGRLARRVDAVRRPPIRFVGETFIYVVRLV